MKNLIRDARTVSFSLWLRASWGAARDRQWGGALAALVLAAASVRVRFSMLGDLPPWMWMAAIITTFAGCSGVAGADDAPIAAALVSALGAFAYALRVRVTSDARTQQAIISAMERYRSDAADALAAVRDEREKRDECERRCDSLVKDISDLRELMHGTGYRLPPMRSRLGGK